jgi:hypothetical protein
MQTLIASSTMSDTMTANTLRVSQATLTVSSARTTDIVMEMSTCQPMRSSTVGSRSST